MIATASCSGMFKNSLPTRVQSLFHLSVIKAKYLEKWPKLKAMKTQALFIVHCEKVKEEWNFVIPAPILVKLMGCGW